MWPSSLRGCLPALLPANCFRAGVQSSTLVCLGRDPTRLPASAFFLLISKVSSLFIKVQDCQACWLKQPTIFPPRALGPPQLRQSCQVCGRVKRGNNVTPHQVIARKTSVHMQNIWEGVLWCRALEKRHGWMPERCPLTYPNGQCPSYPYPPRAAQASSFSAISTKDVSVTPWNLVFLLILYVTVSSGRAPV